MARYKLQKTGVVDTIRGLHIPSDPSNRHWAEYLEWRNAGNTPDPEFTPEEEAEQVRQTEIDVLINHISSGIRTLLRMNIAIYQVGRAKNLWTKEDFTALFPTLVDDISALKTKLDRLEELEQS